MTKWNRRLLKQDIKADTEGIRALKKNGGHGTFSHMKAKKAATIHCATAAHLRGKIHLTNWKPPEEETRRPMTMEEQWQFIEKEAARYVVPEVPAAQPAA